MKLFRFFTLLFFALSLNAADQSNAFSTCSNISTNDSKIIDVNASDVCYYEISGTLDQYVSNKEDSIELYVFKIEEDMNISYTLYNTDSNKDFKYSTALNDCDTNTNTLDAQESYTQGPTLVTASEANAQYLYFYMANANNQEVAYKLVISFGDDCGVGVGVTPPNSSAYANVDVLDGYSGSGNNYNSWITTKVSAKPGVALNAVYLGNNPTNPVPQPYPGSNQSASLTILYKLADMSNGATCESAPTVNLMTTLGGNTPVVSVIDPGETSQLSTPFVVGYIPAGTATPLAKKDLRVKYKSVDFNQLIDDSGVNCAQKSSTGGVVEGIPACLISNSTGSQAATNYKTVFGQDAFDNCYTANGQPCYASNGGVGLPPYDTIYGCFECSVGHLPFTCSSDNFAIRPEKLEITSTAPHMPNLLRSDEDYNTTINAYNFNTTTNSQGYDVTDANNIFNITTKLYDKNDIERNATTTPAMQGAAAFGGSAFDMLNGLSTIAGVAGNEVAGLSFDDVGKVNIRVEDRNWSAVDNDDTPIDCTQNGTYVCGDLNVTFIPHHFDFNTLDISNNDANFTYIANDIHSMAAKISTQIRALNKNDAVTQNFSPMPLYENNVTVIPVVTKSTYFYPDANETNITNNLIGFANGVKNIDDTNSSIYLRFNFQRDVNMSVNPFDVNGSDLNISISSYYVDPADSDDANITGNRNMSATGKSTFIYGRTNAPRQIITGNAGDVFIYYEAHCSGIDSSGIVCDKTLLPNGVDSNSTNDPRWFANVSHVTANSGNVGTITQKNGSIVTATAATGDNPDRTTLTYGGTTFPYKTTMENNASNWLIYNKNNINATSNEFEVEFINPNNSWAGIRENNTTTNSNAAPKTNRRVMW